MGFTVFYMEHWDEAEVQTELGVFVMTVLRCVVSGCTLAASCNLLFS